jgi:uroporphyrinogen decarboxylase
MGLAQNPDYATEVTLQPLARFPLDAAILFSDILTIPDAMGLGLSFAEGEGPRFARPLRDEAAIAALAVPDMQSLDYVFRAVAQIKRELTGKVPLIGFAGSPFTLACYMIEGAGSSDFASVRKMAHARRDLLAHIVDVNARAVVAYLDAQVESGADAVMIFDTWGGLLTAEAYRALSLAPMRRIVESLKGRVPAIVFTRGGGGWLSDIAAIGAQAVGVDWTVDIAAARAQVGDRVALQGNLDPVTLLTDAATVARESARIVRAAGPAPGHVFNLGHGIHPTTPPENVAALVEAVHRTSREMRAGA